MRCCSGHHIFPAHAATGRTGEASRLVPLDSTPGESRQDRVRVICGGQEFLAGRGFDLLTAAEQGSARSYGLVGLAPELAGNMLTPRFDVGDRAAAVAQLVRQLWRLAAMCTIK